MVTSLIELAPANVLASAPTPAPPGTPSAAHRALFSFALITTVCLLGFYNTFSNEFIRDDLGVVVGNPVVTGPFSISEIFSNGYRGGTDDGLYRPLTILTFALNYQWGGLALFSYHLVNLAIHILNSILLFQLLRRILGREHGLVGALLFAAHPVHVEAVTSIVGRAELLAACFGLLVLYIHSKTPADDLIQFRRRLAMAGLYLLGILSKENAVALPLALLAVDFVLGRLKWEPAYFLNTYGPMVAVCLVYFPVRVGVLGAFGPSPDGQYFAGHSPSTVLFTMSEVHFQYLRLMLLPIHLHIDETYQTLVGGFVVAPTPKTIFNLALLIAMMATTIYLFVKRTSAGLFLALFYVLGITVMNIIPIGALMSERFLYLPSIGFAALVDLLLIAHLPLRQPVRATLVGVLICTYLLIGLQRNLDWHDGISMGEIVVGHSPNAPEARFDLGSYYARAGRLEESRAQFDHFIRLEPRQAKGYFALGKYFAATGEPEKARAHYEKALAIDETLSDAHLNLGILYAAAGDQHRAEQFLKDAIRHAPENGLYQFNLGRLLAEMGRIDEARQATNTARELGFSL